MSKAQNPKTPLQLVLRSCNVLTIDHSSEDFAIFDCSVSMTHEEILIIVLHFEREHERFCKGGNQFLLVLCFVDVFDVKRS